MTEHTVHWPEVGIDSDAEEKSDGSDSAVKEWMEHPTLRKVLLTIYLGSEAIRVAATTIVAVGILVGAARFVSLGSNPTITWGFITAVALTMALDEVLKKLTGFSIQYGSFLSSTLVVVSLLRLYLGLKERRNSLDSPSTLASSLPIETIPVLELYKRRNRLM